MRETKKEKISENILKLKQEINSLGQNYALAHVNIGFIEKMELEKECNNLIYSDYLNQINIFTNKCLQNYEDFQSFIALKNIYSEAFIFSVLNSILKVEKIPETTVKSPDFRVSHKGKIVYIEVKSLNMADGTLKHRDIMENALESKIRLENEIQQKSTQKRNGKNIVATDVTTIKPYEKRGRAYDSSSPKLVIETLIDKISQNLKNDQFCYGETLLLVNFSDQLPLLETPRESLQENYIGEYRDNSELFNYLIDQDLSLAKQQEYLSSIESVSKQKIYFFKAKGCLWHVAFGKTGTVLVEKEEGCEAEVLDKQGILHDFDYVGGILFYVEGKFYACLRDIRQTALLNLCSYLEEIDFIESKVIYSTT